MKTKAEKKISKVMREYKAGGLHSGKGGPVVKNQKQAVAIALSQAKVKKK
jgi:ribosomal protein L21E